MKTKFLIFSNAAFLSKASLCEQSIRAFYSSEDYEISIVLYDSKMIKNSRYLEGLAFERIKAVRAELGQYDCVVLLGADCYLYHTLDSLFAVPGRIVLVPHVVTPPREAARYYRTGFANGDVICFRKDAIQIVDWLLTQPMRLQIGRGMFFEQTLLSCLPFIFDGIGICKDPAINYAYYNFYERQLEFINGQFFISGKPLVLCQFSGYINGFPERIGRYYKGLMPPEPVLALFRQYENNLALSPK